MEEQRGVSLLEKRTKGKEITARNSGGGGFSKYQKVTVILRRPRRQMRWERRENQVQLDCGGQKVTKAEDAERVAAWDENSGQQAKKKNVFLKC